MVIRDPVHGDISLGALQSALLDSPEVQRLRGIKQLGTAFLVYPGCTHSRFEHSLGASHVARRIVDQLRRRGTRIESHLEEIICAAVLLHDVTHVPFGHTLEDERGLFPRHDKGWRLQCLLDGSLGESLANHGCRDEVADLIGTDGRLTPQWAGEIVSSTIDADLLDYLRRDAYYAGLAQAYDDRLFRYLMVADGRLAIELAKHGMERLDARSETIQLLRMRYFLTERVYYHHTKVAAGAMISKAVEMAEGRGALSEQDLLAMTDARLMDALRRPARGTPDADIVGLVDALERRDLLKRGYVLSARTLSADERRSFVDRYHSDRRARGEAESTLAQEVGCEESQVVVYCPALTVMKEAAVLVDTVDGLMPLNASDLHPQSEIQALEERYAHLWRFYVFAPAQHAARMADAARSLFGFPSEFVARAA